MDDKHIIALFWARSEQAIGVCAEQYGGYCLAIARHLLGSEADSEECVNDTWLRAWNAIPPERPRLLRAFLGKITRNLALDRLKRASAGKRGGGGPDEVLEELADCLPAGDSVEKALDDRALSTLLNGFLADLPRKTRKIFMQRYWYARSVAEIAGEFGMGESAVKMTLLRTRRQLREALEKEEFL